MGVYIKGMEMPKSCEFCPCKTADAFGGLGCQATGYIPLRKVNQNRPEWCPLVPVPPHGRLVDLDEIDEKHDKLSRDFCHGYFKSTWDFVCAARKIFYDAPTIIPADRKVRKGEQKDER